MIYCQICSKKVESLSYFQRNGSSVGVGDCCFSPEELQRMINLIVRIERRTAMDKMNFQPLSYYEYAYSMGWDYGFSGELSNCLFEEAALKAEYDRGYRVGRVYKQYLEGGSSHE